ncbi:YadA-like family protein [Histophilus somni]|uniref:YadA-like family protein n=1 Tax=Histophilus somni TaxID=731 RepID=UPI00201F7D80|nr:YadA-like family protein [Histophilus somni]
MNKIFKTKYDITTGQTKVVSELANNRQVASRVEGASVGVGQPKCGGFFGGMLGAFKVLPLALLMAGIFGVNNLSFAVDYIEVDSTKVGPNNYYIQNNLGNDSVHLYGWNYKKSSGEYKNFIQTILIGSGASIGASSATAIGYKANARSNATVAIGREVNSSGTQSVALGDKANASGEQSVAMGADTNAMGYASISIGGDDVGASKDQYKYARALSQTVWELYRDNKSNFNNANNYATTSQNTYQQYLADNRKAYSQNFARGRGAISIGARTIAYGDGATALGTLSIAKGNYATSIGTASGALGNSSIALGNETYIYSNNSVGLGSEIQVAADGAMAFGYQAYSGGQGSVAIGRQVLANVGFKEQQDKNDMKALYQKESKSVMSDLYAIDNFQANSKNVFVPDTTLEQGSEIHKINKNRKAGGIAIGEYVAALGTNTQAIGRMAIADGDQSTAIGAYAYTKEGKSISFGYGAKTLQSESVAIGPHATVLGRKSIALGNNAFINKRGSDEISNAIAIGNESEADFNNSVALGYRSTTKYFHNGDKKTAALSGDSAMDLDGYVPEGSSYEIANDKAAGIVSVGGWDNSRQSQVRGKKNSAVGLRRIVNVAPGALDSDVATVGQLKALQYVKNEGLVVYYTVKDDGKVIKLVKDPQGKFYPVDTRTGEPMITEAAVTKDDVLVGAKGANEKIGTQDLGDKIRFGHLKDGKISENSDQAITGSQLKNVGDILGISVNTDNTKFDNPSFITLEYEGSKKQPKTKFKDAVDDLITAVNKGLVIAGDAEKGTITLGSTLTIKAGNTTVTDKTTKTTTEYKSDNIRTAYVNKSNELLIGLKENPTFKKVSLEAEQTFDPDSSKNTVKDKKELITKGYLDGALANVATSFNVAGDEGHQFTVKSTLNIKGADSTAQSAGTTSTTHKNITTKASSDTLEIALNEDIKEVNSISGKEVAAGKQSNGKKVKSEIVFNDKSAGTKINTNVVIKSNGATFTFDRTGLTLSGKQIKGITSGLGINSNADISKNGNKTTIENVLSGNPDNGNSSQTNADKLSMKAVNVQDLSTIAKAIIDKGLKFQGNDANDISVKLGGTLKIIGEKTATTTSGTASTTTTMTTAPDNITVAKKNGTNGTADTLEIKLSDNLKGIKSVANSDTKIELNNGSGGSGSNAKSIVFTSGASKAVTLTGDKFSGVSEISSKDSKSKLTLGADKATVELENGKSKLELKDNEATITAGTDAGSIKINNNGNKKIELSPESGATLTLEKDTTNGGTHVKATGLSTVGLSDDNALIFKNGSDKSAELKVGSTTYNFTETGLDLAGKPITNLGSGLDQKTAASGRQDLDELLKLVATEQPQNAGTSNDGKLNKAINAGDLLHVAKGLMDKGLTFKGNTGNEFTRQLGATVTIKGDGTDLTSKAENGTITFELNKSDKVSASDQKVVTSKAVAEKLQEYTSTATLGKDFLKVTGENIGNDETSKAEGRKKFGGNVGIAEIKLGDTEKSSTELVQADAVIKYLKGTGTDSVKISDSTKTMAKGNHSISIGHEAVSENESAIAIGYGANAKNRNALALGRDSEVLGEHATAIGFQNKVSGNHSGAFGKQNTVKGEHSYAVGAYNEIGGEHTYVLGSSVTTDDKVKNAVILGNQSTGVSDAVSVGSADKQRRIVYVAAPKNQYDAVNKQYVDGLGLNFKGNDNKEIHKKLSQTLEIVGKGLNKNQTAKFNGTNGNIAVINNKQNKLEISLNRDLKGIKSISDSKNKNIATEIRFNSKNDTNSISNSLTNNLTISSNGGTFEFNRKGLHINNKQITGLRSGLLEKHNGNDSERKGLDDLIGENFDKSSIKTHAVNVGDLAKISKEIVEKGYKYKADMPSGNSNDTSIKLGSTISIVKWTDTPASGTGQPAVTVGTGTTSQTQAVKYTGDNLTTRYTYDSSNGNAKIEIGFKDAPKFSKVTLSQDQTYGNGSSVENNDLISKSYLDAALKDFKFNVEYGGKKVQIGRDDTLKFVGSQNIQVISDDKKAGATPAAPAPTPTDTATASTTPTAPASDATGGAGSTSPTVAGSSSGGTNGDSAGTAVASSTPTSTTTAVVTIGTTEDLKNIKSISNGDKAKIALDKESNTIKFTSGATPEDVTLTGSTLSGVSEINKADDKGALKLTKNSATLESASDNSNVALENNEATITAGKDKGSLKLEADKATLTSAKDGSSLALAKDSATVKVDDKATFTFNKNGLDLGSNKITALASGLSLQDNASGSGDSDPNKIIDNVLAGDPDEGKTKDKIANNAVNVKDLSTVAKALMEKGLTFQGNDGKEVHKKLGETLSIKGEGAVGETATDNIVVRAKEGELQIGLTKNIRNIDTISIAGTGDNSGKDVFIDAEGMTTTAQLEDGTVLVNNQTAEGVSTIAKKEDGSILVNNQTAEANILSNGKHTTEVKAGEVAIKDKSGQEIVSLKVAEGENGQDGKGATLAFAKDGENGTGVIMGLKDLDATADGSSAANKNYVDEKMSDLDSNRPFDFYIQEGKEYTKVVKGRDGKFYDPELLQGAKYDVDSKKYIAQDGQEVTPESDKVIIRAEPTTAPIGINNVASGLGISAIEESEKQSLTKTIEEKKAELEKTDTALQTAKDQVGEKQKALEEKTNALSQVASERPALLMQKAEIEQQLKGLGASDPRRATAQAELDKVKEALTQNDQKVTEATKTANEASEALKQAKVALADNVLKAYAAQQALATAEETLRNKEFGVDKVKDLLSGNSNIAEDNVATIKDVKALAKAGLSFEGNDGKRLHKDLSETLAIKGEENASGDKFNSDHTAAGNIKVEMAQDGKGLEVKLSDQLKNLTSVETKKDDQGRSTTLLSRGVMVQNDTTKEQALFSENRLAFFKDGALGLNLDGKSRALKVGEKAIISINDKGEALVSDLNEFSSGMTITNKNYVDTKNNELRTQLNNTDRTLRAGIAGANAASGLASVSMPGKSMLAISAAGYGGENAVAIGYSRMSDNGKIMLQLQGNRNSRGKAAGSVSIGYQW